jgi:hypothetical protein
MEIPPNRSGSFSQKDPRAWRAFILEFLCGVLTVTWYVFALAEKWTFNVLTGLTGFAHAFFVGTTRDCGQFKVPFDEAELFAEQHDCAHVSSYEFKPSGFDRSENQYRRPGSRDHMTWVLSLASSTGLSLGPGKGQTIYCSIGDPAAASIADANVIATKTSKGALEAEWHFPFPGHNIGLSSDFCTGRESFRFQRHEL